MSHIDSAVFLIVMYAMLLTPKLIGAGIILTHRKATRLYGGRLAFFTSFIEELLLSIAYAPIMMVQQTKAVLGNAFGRVPDWVPQRRAAQAYPLRTLVQFHWLETLLGAILTFGLASGLVSLWLIPIAASLILAVPLSALSAVSVSRFLPRALTMQSPVVLREPGIVSRARAGRQDMAAALSNAHIAAE
jgi:membrane glycosyltransferase